MINGLQYIDNFLSDHEETELIQFIDNQEWNTTLKRRTQHYGYNYNYDSTKLTQAKEIPDKFKEIIQKFSQINLTKLIQNKIEDFNSQKLKDYGFDQVIVNEYEIGQGISAHIDHVKNFSDIIVSLSLGSPCEMVFCEKKNKDNVFKQILQRKSLVILSEDARYKFTHAIPARKSDNGVKRSKRISLTFRKVNKFS